MDIKINSLCPHELVSEDNGGGVKFNNGLDLQGLYLYEKYYPYKQEAEFNAEIAAGKPANMPQDEWNTIVADIQSELNWMKTTPVGIVFKSAAVTQGAIYEIWPEVYAELYAELEKEATKNPSIDPGKMALSMASNEIYTAPMKRDYIDPTTKSPLSGDLSYYAGGYVQDVSYYSYSPIYIREYFSNKSTISQSSYNGKKISENGINEDLLGNKLKDINADDAFPGGYPTTDKYLLCVKGNYSESGEDCWDIGGMNMTTNKNGGLCRIYSKYRTGFNWLANVLGGSEEAGSEETGSNPLAKYSNDIYFAKMVFCFKQMLDDSYDYTRAHTDLLSPRSDIEYARQYILGTPEALKKAVTDGDAVFVYRDDLLNFTNFVQKKLGVTVE